LETIRDRGFLPKDHRQQMAYDESNGHVTAVHCPALNDHLTMGRRAMTGCHHKIINI